MKPLRLMFFTFVICANFVACGGGTRGTGLGDDPDSTSVNARAPITFSGSIVGATGLTTLVDLDTGESTTIDDKGKFVLPISLAEEPPAQTGTNITTVELEIEDGAILYRVTIDTLGAEEYSLTIDLAKLTVIQSLVSGEEVKRYELMVIQGGPNE